MTGSHDKTSDEKDHDHEKTRSCDKICASTREGTVTTFAARKKDGRLLLEKTVKGSAAFLVKFRL